MASTKTETETDTDQQDLYTDTGSSSMLPQSTLLWVALALSVVLFVGAIVSTGPIAAIMGVWGLTVLGGSIVGYTLHRLWFYRSG